MCYDENMYKFFRFVALLVIFLTTIYFIYQYIAIPKQIFGANAGKYQEGSIVLFMSSDVSQLLSTVRRGDVISFENDLKGLENVAVVEGIAGQKTTMEIFDSADKSLGEVVPDGHVAVKFETSNQLRAVPEENITGVAWLSLPKN